MLVGIQGTGKTTAAVKLARFYQKRGLRPAIICADTYRPGAFDQLKQLADKVNVPVYGEPNSKNTLKIVKKGMEQFSSQKYDLIIADTAGRHKDEAELMSEMRESSQTDSTQRNNSRNRCLNRPSSNVSGSRLQ